MKKRGLAVLTLAAVLSLGVAGISAYAAGWEQQNGNWVYLDSQGSKVYNTWKKGADNLERYIGANGYMVVDSWVDNLYYVDSNGIMAAGKWLQLPNSNSESGYSWYYFQTSGKRVEDGWKKINNKSYYFDDNGVMQTGWADDDLYYCTDNGDMLTGWQKLELPEGVDPPENRDKFNSEYEDGRYWFYFGTTGKKVRAEEDTYKEQKIDGTYYVFDADGIMQTGWVEVDNDGDSEIEGYRYLNTNGQVVKGWISLETPEDLASRYEYDVEWFYFASNGKPKVGPAKGEANTKDFTRINGLTFLFNENGTPVYGLQKVYIGNTGNYTASYFGDRAASSLQKGQMKIEEGDGVETQFYFTTSGQGLSGVYNNHLYYMGKLQKAESGSKYQVISVSSDNSNKNYVVNTAGKIAKNTTVKDSDGNKYKTNSSGILTHINEEAVGSGESFNAPTEPVWND